VRFRFSEHAREQMAQRRIPRQVVQAVLECPDQIVPEHGGRRAHQSRVRMGKRLMLVRVIVDERVEPPSS